MEKQTARPTISWPLFTISSSHSGSPYKVWQHLQQVHKNLKKLPSTHLNEQLFLKKTGRLHLTYSYKLISTLFSSALISQCIWACRHYQDDALNFKGKSSIRRKGDLSDLERGIAVGASSSEYFWNGWPTGNFPLRFINRWGIFQAPCWIYAMKTKAKQGPTQY